MVVQSLQTKKMLLHLQETLCCDGQSLYGWGLIPPRWLIEAL
jgi:hypothetical protein